MAENTNAAPPARVLLVDDNDAVRTSLELVLRKSDFHVTVASSVAQALRLINDQIFDVLLCDLHMPGAGDGFTVVSAMRHTNPGAVTLVFTGYPALKEAMNAILLQADEILVKPLAPATLVELIREKLRNGKDRPTRSKESVAQILAREATKTIADWLRRVDREPELASVPLTAEQRTGHLSRLLQELVHRLRVPRSLGTKQVSHAAAEHGKVRFQQGYSVPMIIEESRILQVSIFDTLQRNLATVDFSLVLGDIMTIADEVDSQLKQAIVSFTKQAATAAA
jgi:DNA-binding response OmpR family regulator